MLKKKEKASQWDPPTFKMTFSTAEVHPQCKAQGLKFNRMRLLTYFSYASSSSMQKQCRSVVLLIFCWRMAKYNWSTKRKRRIEFLVLPCMLSSLQAPIKLDFCFFFFSHCDLTLAELNALWPHIVRGGHVDLSCFEHGQPDFPSQERAHTHVENSRVKSE